MTVQEKPAANGEKKPRTKRRAQGQSANAITLLKNDHKAISKLLEDFKFDAAPDAKRRSLRQIAGQWIRHNDFEENELLPAVLKAGNITPELEQADVERDMAKLLLVDLQSGVPGSDHFDAKFRVLSAIIKKLVEDEERPKTGLFALARAAGLDMNALGERLNAHKREMTDAEDEPTFPPMPTSLRIPGIRRPEYPEESMEMDRQSNVRERDDQGRFMSDDDDDRRSGGRGSSRSRDDYDDDRRGGNRGGRSMQSQGSSRRSDDDEGRGWHGDPEGHSEASRRGWEERGSSRSRGRSEDYDDNRRSSRSMSRYEDDDRRSSGGRGRGGWFGDPEGHSEAAREGWDNPDHGPSGWYGDRRGHAEASRRGWDNPDHGPSGWYGDPEGHSEASRRGWDERQGSSRSRGRSQDYDDDRRSSRSRSRDDDDDDRRGSRGGRGGWSGDPEGHAEAARRGWENRR